MGSRLRNLTIVAIASLLRGLRALETNSELSLLTSSLEIRNFEPLPTCIYSSSIVQSASGDEHQYIVTLDLTGEGWTKICNSRPTMRDSWQSIRYRCEKQWRKHGLGRRLEGPPHAELDGKVCRMTITVRADPQRDLGFPNFEQPCIWKHKPYPTSCAEDPTMFPWPLECQSYDVRLQLEYCPLAVHNGYRTPMADGRHLVTMD